MTKQDEHKANEAEMLLKNAVLMQAFNDIRAAAVEALVKTDPANTNEIIRLQAKAELINEVCEDLQAMVSVIAEQEQAIA